MKGPGLFDEAPSTATSPPPREAHAGTASVATPNDPMTELAAPAAEEIPWRRVATIDVDRAIQGTPLEPVVRYLQTPTNPPLPLECVFGKGLAIAGSILAKPREGYDPNDNSGERGSGLARFRILTGGGQVTNVWFLLVGESGTGKDIGNISEGLASQFDNYIGSSGSAAGLYEAYMERGAGLLGISEFEPFLDARSWQSMARTMLTNAFNQGHFDIRLSGRAVKRRMSRYCYPSIVANIQPEVFRRFAGSLQVQSGFLPRFLISVLPRREWRPATGIPDSTAVIEALRVYDALAGEVTPEDGYLGDLDRMFYEFEAIPAVYKRLVNEYGPRIACILQPDGRHIRPETWDRVRTIIQWFYAQAETVFGLVKEDGTRNQFESQLRSLRNYILRKTATGGVTKTVISRNKGEGTTAAQRDKLLEELLERGWIAVHPDGRYTTPDGSGTTTKQDH